MQSLLTAAHFNIRSDELISNCILDTIDYHVLTHFYSCGELLLLQRAFTAADAASKPSVRICCWGYRLT